jgi:hypothetical protein
MKNLSKFFYLFFFIIFSLSFFLSIKPIKAQFSCPDIQGQCGDLSKKDQCVAPCLWVAVSGGGKGPSSCQCQKPTNDNGTVACGGTCQTSTNCNTECPYCRANGSGTGMTCQNTSVEEFDESLDCDKEDNPEFHSLRPYPGKPCRDSSKALFCSNNLIFTESFDIDKFPSCKDQAPDTNGPFTCIPSSSDGYVAPHNLIADLSDSEFPILGKTEYVSWYLNGVTDRAEYGDIKSTDSATFVNYSGPLKKLLPSVIQDAQRVLIVDSGIAKTQNNDQIVVCAGEFGIPFIGDLFGIGPTTPIKCYKGDGSKAQGDVYKLSTWNGKLSLPLDFIQKVTNFYLDLNFLIPGLTKDVIKTSLLNHWTSRKPPLPWDNDPFEKDRKMTNIEYRKYYNEWRGKTCVIVPVVNMLICLDNIYIPNKYAQLFEYVPLSAMTDKKGEELVNSIEYTATSGTIDGQKPTDPSTTIPAPLYFAHTQESKDLIGLLNKVFTPMDCKNNNGNLSCSPLANVSVPSSTENTVCSTVNVRTNPGDKLFPNGPSQLKIPNVTYQITSVPCEVKVITKKVCNYWEDPNQCPGQPINTCCDKVVDKEVVCNAEVVIKVKTDSTTPYANEIYKSAVADSGSTFRKIFPKIESGAPVECIADIPSISSVTIDASKSQKPTGGTQTFDVNNPTTGSNSNPQLTFPHIGSVYEYFLKGIQTALRPKGYGEPIVSGSLCSNLPNEEINCDQTAPDITIPGLLTKDQTYTLAVNWVGGKLGNQVKECYNDTVRRSQSNGINVALTIALWLHESNASNYTLGYLQDFGAYWPGTFPGYVAQITEYFRRAKSPIYTKNGPICQGRSDVIDDFMAWALVYKSGKCDPTEPGAAQFYDEIKKTFQLVASGCGIPTTTTDTSCP